MTLPSSGELKLQGLGDTNPTTTTTNTPVYLNDTWTTGLDGLFQMQQLDEIFDGSFIPVTIIQGDAWGYNQGAFATSSYVHTQFNYGSGIGGYRYNGMTNFGSGVSSYTDGGGTTRTISAIFWGTPDASPINARLFVFALNGTGISNSDNTFNKIEIITSGGTTVTINRSDLSYDSSENGDTWWYMSGGSSDSEWTTIGNLGTPTSGSTYTIKVYGPTTTTTVTTNTGIAEEFGGADSSDVKMSDYYKGASSGYVNTGTGTTNIPTSGSEISFSDFYGSSFVAGVLTSVEIQPATRYANISGPRGAQYEHIMHGFGQAAMATYNITMSSSDGLISDSIRNNAAQGSIIGSPDLSNWGVSSTLGTLACIVHFNTLFTGTTTNVAMIVTGTGSNSNSGFTTLTATRSTMSTLALNRTDATYYYDSNGTARIWIWSSASPGSSETTLSNYQTGSPSSFTTDSTLFPGGDGSSTANTTTTNRTTWTIS